MAYPVGSIANAFIKKAKDEGTKLTPMKLQKLVYYAHGWYLAITGKPLIDGQVEAWRFGPVIPSLYREFKEFGKADISRYARSTDFDMDGVAEMIPSDPIPRVIVNKIWKLYGHLSATQLSKMTHAKDGPWDQVNKRYDGSIPKDTDINVEIIKDHFAKKLSHDSR